MQNDNSKAAEDVFVANPDYWAKNVGGKVVGVYPNEWRTYTPPSRSMITLKLTHGGGQITEVSAPTVAEVMAIVEKVLHRLPPSQEEHPGV